MEVKIEFSQIPYHYPMCLNRECSRAATCLRQIAEQSVPSDISHWVIISPKFLATLNDSCPHYRSSAKVRFAKGFLTILDNLPHKQMQIVINNLLATYGRRTYYRNRKGERLLSPKEQREFFEILKKCGVTTSCEFDAYVLDYDW